MKDVIIFDFDGVIVDSFKTTFHVLNTLHKKYKLPQLTEEKFLELLEGNIWEEYVNSEIDRSLIKDFKTDFNDLFSQKHTELTFFPGIKDCITHISKNFELIIISSNYSDTIKKTLKAEGLDGYFTKIVGAEILDTKREKISSFILENNTEPRRIFFVSDTAGDIRETEGLGVHAIAVSWGYHPITKLEASNPKVIVHSPHELQNYLLGLSIL